MSQSIVKLNNCVWKSGKSWSHALLIVSLFHTVSGSDHTAPGGVNDCGFSDIVWLQIGIEHRHHSAFSKQSFKCQLPVMGGHVRPGLKFQSFSFLTFFFFACKCQFYFLLTWYFQESLILFKSHQFTSHVTVSVYGYLWRDIKYSKDYYAKTSRTKSSYAFWFVLKLQRRPLVSRLLLNRHKIKHQLKL